MSFGIDDIMIFEDPKLLYLYPFWLLWCISSTIVLKESWKTRSLEPVRYMWYHASKDIIDLQYRSDPSNWKGINE